MLSWLCCNLERDTVHVASLFCSVSRKYECSISSFNSFSNSWIAGSTNLNLSNMLDHAKSEVDKTVKCKLRAEKFRENGESLVL